MEGFAIGRWLKGFAILLAVLLLASFYSFDLNDPTITNLRYPAQGIANWAGLPGALIGGSLVEILGGSALWAPLLLLNWLILPRARRAPGRYLFFGAAAALCSAALHGMAMSSVLEAALPSPASPGLAGLAAGGWMEKTTGPWVGVALILPTLAYALRQVFHLPLLEAALRDIRTFGGFLLRWEMAWLGRIRTGLAGSARASAARGREWDWRLREIPLRLRAAAARLREMPRLGWSRTGGRAGAAVPGGAKTFRNGERRGGGGALAGVSRPAIAKGDAFDAWLSGTADAQNRESGIAAGDSGGRGRSKGDSPQGPAPRTAQNV